MWVPVCGMHKSSGALPCRTVSHSGTVSGSIATPSSLRLRRLRQSSIMPPMTSLWFEAALLPGGWASQVRIQGSAGRIESLLTGVAPAPEDERHAIALPGLPNLHSHAFQRGLAGLTERRGAQSDSFWSWRDLMYQFVERMDPEDLEAITALAYAEMLEAGFTRVGEFHYLHHDRDGAPFADRK